MGVCMGSEAVYIYSFGGQGGLVKHRSDSMGQLQLISWSGSGGGGGQ